MVQYPYILKCITRSIAVLNYLVSIPRYMYYKSSCKS
jgi:hypothetical protein